MKPMPQCPPPQRGIRRQVPRPTPVFVPEIAPQRVGIIAYIGGKIAQMFTREKWEQTDEVIIEHDRAVSREIRRTTRTYTRETRSFFGD